MAGASLPLTLPEGLVILPVAELPPEIRRRFQSEDDAYAVSRPSSRIPTRIIDPGTARLLEEFRTPATVVHAVLNYSRAIGQDPEEILPRVHPVLVQLAADQLLVPAESDLSRSIEPSLEPGERFGQYEILESISALDDSELYRARSQDGDLVALKLARETHAPAMASLLAHEAEILRRLGGGAVPRLVACDTLNGRPFIAQEWIQGLRVPDALLDLGDPAEPAWRRKRLSLAVRILERYADLHRAGVLHGDVHPGNILVTPDGDVRLVDLAMAGMRDDGAPAQTLRGGVLFFLEPEVVDAWGRGRLPSSTEAGEQYALGAVVYLLLTSAGYLDFSLDPEEIRRQITEEPPRAFQDAGSPPWPEVEAAVGRALSKRPEDRFPSVQEFVDRLREVLAGMPAATDAAVGGKQGRAFPSRALREFLESYLDRVRPGGEAYVQGYEPPRASIMFGAAGLAYALYRMACLREDPELLALSDLWAGRSLAGGDNPESYYNPNLQLTPELLGPNALFHTASGIEVTAALVALAQGNVGLHTAHAAAFLRAADGPTPNLDLTMGRAGALLGCLLLHEARPAEALAARGNVWAREIWDAAAAAPAIPEASLPLNLGMAHGWAGILYVLLRWHRATGADLPDVRPRLRELAACAEPVGRGLSWPWREPGRRESVGSMPGWCNGSAGFVLLWTLAAEVLGDTEWTAIAERAGWHAWQRAGNPGSLCCGSVGVAYALLNLARHTGDPVWIDRAARLADQAAASGITPGKPPHSLYKGDLGLALLACELEQPESARLPFFEHEGWPVPRG